MTAKFSRILIIVSAATLAVFLLLSVTLSGSRRSVAAGNDRVTIEISDDGFAPAQVVLIPGGQVVWHNATTRTITMTHGWPQALHLPVMANEGAPAGSLPIAPAVTPTPLPQLFETVTISAGARLTVSFQSIGTFAWSIPSIVTDTLIIVKIEPPTPTPTPSPTPTNTPTPWAHGDDDGDRLSNGAETNTKNYVSLSNTGTDPSNPDTDGDGLPDGDEVLGTQNGLRLDAMGTNPLKKDVLVEFDWFDDDSNALNSAGTDCGFHSHKPSPNVIDRLTVVFANAPVNNPDGSTGINLIVDVGGAWPLNEGEQIPENDGIMQGEIDGEQHAQLKAENFSVERLGYFHYVLMIHEYRTDLTKINPSSGLAEVNKDDVIISMGCFVGPANDPLIASTIMHELGHNFGLRHGGLNDDRCNYKPNHNSIMNYRYQFKGLDRTCNGAGDGLGLAGRTSESVDAENTIWDMMSYSNGGRLRLDEFHLDERSGMCGQFIDWNRNFIQNILQSPLNINVFHPANQPIPYSASLERAECGGEFSILRDYDEWEGLNLAGVRNSGRVSAEVIREASIFDLLPDIDR